MCSGPELMAALAIGRTGFNAWSAYQSGKSQMSTIAKSVTDVYRNSAYAAREINETAEQQYTDRMRAARKEMAAMTALVAETGATDASSQRLLYEMAYGENVDLMRIRDNAEDQLAALDRQNRAAYASAKGQIKAVRKQTKYAIIGSLIGGATDLAGIGAQAHANNQLRQSLASVNTQSGD